MTKLQRVSGRNRYQGRSRWRIHPECPRTHNCCWFESDAIGLQCQRRSWPSTTAQSSSSRPIVYLRPYAFERFCGSASATAYRFSKSIPRYNRADRAESFNGYTQGRRRLHGQYEGMVGYHTLQLIPRQREILGLYVERHEALVSVLYPWDLEFLPLPQVNEAERRQ